MKIAFIIKFKLLEVTILKLCIRIVCLLAASLMATHTLAQELSGWSDKTVCRLASSQQDDPQYLQEAKKRGISCDEDIAIKSSASVSKASSKKSNKLLPNTLKQIKVVKDWEPVADFEALKEYAKKVPINSFRIRKNLEWNCLDRITNVSPYPDKDEHRPWTHCQAYVHWLGLSNPQVIGDVLLKWASAKKDPMVFILNKKSNVYHVAGYDIPSTLGTFAQFYALWYDEIEYTPEDREQVDSYMTKKLMEQKFPILNTNDRRKPCDINNIKSVYHKKTGSNNCGNIRMKVSVGEIMLGFRLENQALLDDGHDNMYVVQAFINEDGVNVNHASRGSNTVNYSWEYTYYASLLAELYATVGYDYFEHTLPRGAKVHEYLSFNYRLLKDFKLTARWAKNNVGSRANPYKDIKDLTQEEYQKTENARDVYSWKDGDKEFVKAHTKFVKKYMPDLYALSVKEYMGSVFNVSPNFGVHPYMLHLSNNLIEENIRAEQEAIRLALQRAEWYAKNKARMQKNILKIKAKEAEDLKNRKAKRIEDASKLSIFELEGETLNSTLDKLDYIATESPRKYKIYDGAALHKAYVQGNLKIRSGKLVDFTALAFQKDLPKEKRLVINISDLLFPGGKSFKRHIDSLQKKCGSGLMAQGWLSFISETSNIENAKSQQCHYDYFKDANDKQAWELFQAILGGTDSILDYLQTNVEG